MRTKKTHWLRNTLLVLIACAILGTCLSIAVFMGDSNSSTYAAASIQLSYDGAASGLAPNGYRFDIHSIFSEEVIDEALKASGMESRYTAEGIYNQLNIRGDYPSDINDQIMNYESILDFSSSRVLSLSSYHPTLFRVSLYNDFDKTISSADLEKLLNNIMLSARAYFSKIYAVSTENPQFRFELSNYDYSQQLTILSRTMNRTRAHAQSLYEKAPAFKNNGIGFSDIAIRLESLINNDIDQLNGNIILSGVTKNADRLLMQYQYELQSLTIELEKQNECLSDLDKLIASYEKNEIIYLSSADSWTKIDGNSSETYDALVAERKSIADKITEISKEIDLYTLQMNDLLKYNAALASSVYTDDPMLTAEEPEAETGIPNESAAADEASVEAAAQKMVAMEAEIAFIADQYESILKSFSDLISAYNAEILNDLTVQLTKSRYTTRTLISSAFIVTAIKTAGPICAVGFMVCLVLIIRSRSKEHKALLRMEKAEVN